MDRALPPHHALVQPQTCDLTVRLPDRWLRPLKHVFVLGFLSVQFGLPLSYYLVRDDPYDERFAWRMFSPIRMVECQAQFSDGGEPVDLAPHLAQAWRTWLERGHARVAREFGRHYCAEQRLVGEDPQLTVDFRCRLPDGAIDRLVPASEDLCSPR
jgi:hypothetical protein